MSHKRPWKGRHAVGRTVTLESIGFTVTLDAFYRTV
jgi:hypothetical protein